MLENIVELAPTPQIGQRCLEWMTFMENEVEFWPFGGVVHQKNHWSRVLVLAMTIAHHEGLGEADMDALAMATTFHDTRRLDSWLDLGHGQRAADYYAQYCQRTGLRFDPRAYLAIRYHDLNDDEGIDAVREWDATHDREDDWTVGALTIYQIFKDSDGLDRMRLKEEALDLDYMRLEYSRTLKPFALQLLHASQEPGTWADPQPAIARDYLVVVDVQNDFVTGSLGTQEARDALRWIVRKVHDFDGVVVFTKDTHSPNYLQSLEGQNLPVEHCIYGTEGWELVPQLEEFRREHDSTVYLKGTFGSMDLTRDIEAAYARGKLRSVEFVGLCTDICVVSNVLAVKARVPNLHISVDSRCCAGVTPLTHNAALMTMRRCQIDVH